MRDTSSQFIRNLSFSHCHIVQVLERLLAILADKQVPDNISVLPSTYIYKHLADPGLEGSLSISKEEKDFVLSNHAQLLGKLFWIHVLTLYMTTKGTFAKELRMRTCKKFDKAVGPVVKKFGFQSLFGIQD